MNQGFDSVRTANLEEALGYKKAEMKWSNWGDEETGDGDLTIVLNAGLKAPAFGSPDFNTLLREIVTFDELAPQLLGAHPKIKRVIAHNRFHNGQENLGTRSVASGEPDRTYSTLVKETRAFLDATGVRDYMYVSHSAGGPISTGLAFTAQPDDRHRMAGAVLIDPVPLDLDPLKTLRVLIPLKMLAIRMSIQQFRHGIRHEPPSESTKGLREVKDRSLQPDHGFPDIPVSLIHANWKQCRGILSMIRRLLPIKRIEVAQRHYLSLVCEDNRNFIASESGHNLHGTEPETVLDAVQWVAERASQAKK